MPAFGENVFYVQQYINDDPAQIYRQRIYVFVPDYEQNAIRLIIHIPSDAEALVDAHLDNSKLDGLTPEATRTLPGCDVFWKRQANRFVGFMKEGACTYMSERSGKRIIIKDDLVLTENEIWIADSATDEDGNWVFGNKAGTRDVDAFNYHTDFPIGHFVLLISMVQILALAAALIFLPLRKLRHEGVQTEGKLRIFLYFAALGLGFMLFEIALMQKLVIFLGHPTYALSVVLTSLLASAGIGSLLSGRIKEVRKRHLLLILLGVLAAWGEVESLHRADIDGTGVVDFDDLLAVLDSWRTGF